MVRDGSGFDVFARVLLFDNVPPGAFAAGWDVAAVFAAEVGIGGKSRSGLASISGVAALYFVRKAALSNFGVKVRRELGIDQALGTIID